MVRTIARLLKLHLPTCTCIGIHPGRVEPSSPIELTTPRTEALQARRSCARSLETATQPKTRDPERDLKASWADLAHILVKLNPHIALAPS